MQKQQSFKGKNDLGTLFLVPTPIGNLEDMTIRCLNTLKSVDLIASEDTRNTQKLLNHFEITTPQRSLHEHNYQERIPQLTALLLEGRSIAQVSDAGMPSISDPGHELVAACIEAQIPVVSLPGPTAGLTALIASGLNPQPNLFYGFLPRKKSEQQKALTELLPQTATMIFYESPHRIGETVKNMAAIFGSERQGVICRELTKLHEEYLRGSLTELAAYLKETDLKGECCLMVAGNPDPEGWQVVTAVAEERTVKEQVEELIASGMKPNGAIKEIAQRLSKKKQEIYNEYHELN